MKNLQLGSALVLFAAAAFGQQAAPAALRRTMVLYKGQNLVYTSAAPVITISTPPNSPTNVEKHGFQQYGQSVSLQAINPGEVKLELEYTDQHIGEVLNVVVTDRKTSDQFRAVSGELSGIVGVDDSSVQVAGDQVVILGDLYSAADERGCTAREGKNVICAARQNSVSSAVYPDQGYVPNTSIELKESYSPISTGTTTGLESLSRWSALIRLGDVPVATISSASRSDCLKKAALFASRINRAAAEWKKQSDQKGIGYPVTFTARSVAGRYQIAMTSRFDQGTKGETILDLAPEELEEASSHSGGGPDRLMKWWAALLQDSFRLYYMAQRPEKTLAGGNGGVLPLYENAVRLGGKLDRSAAPAAVSRGYYAIKLARGGDPLAPLLTQPPASFGQ